MPTKPLHLNIERAIHARQNFFTGSTPNKHRMRPMPYEPFRVIAQPGAAEGLQILHVKGPITHESSPKLVEAVIAVSDPRLIIDLSKVPLVDSVAIGALVRAYVHCQKTNRRLAFVGMNPRVKSVIKLTGVDPLFDSYTTIAEAESALA
jgi:anti-anti-sigma factor